MNLWSVSVKQNGLQFCCWNLTKKISIWEYKKWKFKIQESFWITNEASESLLHIVPKSMGSSQDLLYVLQLDLLIVKFIGLIFIWGHKLTLLYLLWPRAYLCVTLYYIVLFCYFRLRLTYSNIVGASTLPLGRCINYIILHLLYSLKWLILYHKPKVLPFAVIVLWLWLCISLAHLLLWLWLWVLLPLILHGCSLVNFWKGFAAWCLWGYFLGFSSFDMFEMVLIDCSFPHLAYFIIDWVLSMNRGTTCKVAVFGGNLAV